MLSSRRARGFSLIEAIVVMAIMALLVGLGGPELTAYLHNSRIKAATTSFYGAAQTARVEAVRRNQNVEVILTNDDPVPDNVDSATLAANGRNWMVRSVNPADPTKYLFISGKPAKENSSSLSSNSVQVLAHVVGDSSTQRSRVTFNGLSSTNPPSGSTTPESVEFNFTNAQGGACDPSGPMRCLRVVISAGGQINACDPVITTVGDSRRC